MGFWDFLNPINPFYIANVQGQNTFQRAAVQPSVVRGTQYVTPSTNSLARPITHKVFNPSMGTVLRSSSATIGQMGTTIRNAGIPAVSAIRSVSPGMGLTDSILRSSSTVVQTGMRSPEISWMTQNRMNHLPSTI